MNPIRSPLATVRRGYVVITALMLIPAVIAMPAPSGAQQAGAPSPFTAQDALDLQSLSVADLSEDGRWLVCTLSRRRDRMGADNTRYGDPTYTSPSALEAFVLDGEDGSRTPLFDGPVRVRSFTWSPDGSRLAYFRHEDGAWRLYTWERERDRHRVVRLRSDKPISSSSDLEWLPDGSGFFVELRAPDWEQRARAAFLEVTEGPIVVHDGSEPFLEWDAVRQMNRLTIPAIASADGRELKELQPEGDYSAWRFTEDGLAVSFTQNFPLKTTYERGGGAEYELALIDLAADGGRRVLRERSDERLSATFSEDGTRFAWTEKGDVLIQGIAEDEARNLTKDLRPFPGQQDTGKVNLSVMRFSPAGSLLLVSSREAYWLLDPSGPVIRKVWDRPDEEDSEEPLPRMSLQEWSPDGRYLYFSYASRQRWERGMTRLDLQDGSMTDLAKDGSTYSGWRLTEDGQTWYFESSDGDHPEELYRAAVDLSSRTRLTETNTWVSHRTLTRSELIKYRDTDGEELFGILYYPVGYEEGRRYPLVCEIYETFFDNSFNTNMNILANQGWFVLRPSVNLEIGYPGEAWVKGVTAAVNRLIDRGLVDPEKVGVHGTSYGGYATALLITQTPRFAAAINISGKVNMVSFYGDSPRLGVRNITAPEIGQDRIGGSLWEYPERYLEHSAILFADRIETPLLLITGDLDPNVPARQSMEMYYAMRRLGKEVVWVRYVNGAHSPPNTPEEYADFWDRITGWYRTHFEGKEEGEKAPPPRRP